MISCLLPTYDRPGWVSLAVGCWLRQEMPAFARELIVVDDGAESVRDLLPAGGRGSAPRWRYIHLQGRHSIGAKLNLACELARGNVLCRWDDDDWHAPWRLQQQLNALERAQADVCGLAATNFVDVASGAAWRYQTTSEYLIGGSLMFRRCYWEERRFEDRSVGEDGAFIKGRLGGRAATLSDDSCYVATIHDSNTCRRMLSGREWSRLPGHAAELVEAWWWSERPRSGNLGLVAHG